MSATDGPTITTAPLPGPPTDHRAEAARQRGELLARAHRTEPDVRLSQYRGVCASCRLPIEAGRDRITNAIGQWAHLACSMCVTCGTWVTADDSTPVPDSVGRVHTACQELTVEVAESRTTS